MRIGYRFLLMLTVGSMVLLPFRAVGQQKLAQTGMKFLNVGTNPRLTAMGEAMTAVEWSSPAMFSNPAGMARMKPVVDMAFGWTGWIADITHHHASIAFSPSRGAYGIIGISALSVDYGQIEETIRWPNEEGYIDLGTFSPRAFAIGLSYARALTDRFSIGANVKYVSQNLGSGTIGFAGDNLVRKKNFADVLAYDFGMLYRTGFKSLNFGVTVRNFSKEVRYEREAFQLPLIFRIGLAMDVMDLFEGLGENHAFLLAVDATHPRDYPEQVNVGAEYYFMRLLALRAGYMFNNDEYGLTAGVGVQRDFGNLSLGVDYSYTPFGVFKEVHRIAIQMAY